MVRDALAAPRVEVAQLAAVFGDVSDAHVRDAAAVRDAQVAQPRLQLGDLPHAKVADEAAVAHAQFLDGCAVNHQVAQALVGDAHAAAQVQVGQLSAVGGNGVQSFVLQDEAVCHVQVADGDLLPVQGRQLDGGFASQTDARDLGAAYGEKHSEFRPAVKTNHTAGLGRQVWNGVLDVMKVSSHCKCGITLTDCSDVPC